MGDDGPDDKLGSRHPIRERSRGGEDVRQIAIPGEDDAYLYVNALRELFGLDAPTAPLEEHDAEVRPLREARRRKRPAS